MSKSASQNSSTNGSPNSSKENCPCDSHKTFAACCQPVLKDITLASSPEQLMRSRYTAFTLKDMNYIFESTHPQARHEFDRKSNQEWADQAQFSKLEILKSSNEGNKGIVEFKAHFKINDAETIHHEVASFRKQSKIWYFRDATIVK